MAVYLLIINARYKLVRLNGLIQVFSKYLLFILHGIMESPFFGGILPLQKTKSCKVGLTKTKRRKKMSTRFSPHFPRRFLPRIFRTSRGYQPCRKSLERLKGCQVWLPGIQGVWLAEPLARCDPPIFSWTCTSGPLWAGR